MGHDQVRCPCGEDHPDVCLWCEEPMGDGEHTVAVNQGTAFYHRECLFRVVSGGANHVKGLCGCHGGTEPPDPPGLSRRDAARAALSEFFARLN